MTVSALSHVSSTPTVMRQRVCACVCLLVCVPAVRLTCCCYIFQNCIKHGMLYKQTSSFTVSYTVVIESWLLLFVCFFFFFLSLLKCQFLCYSGFMISVLLKCLSRTTLCLLLSKDVCCPPCLTNRRQYLGRNIRRKKRVNLVTGWRTFYKHGYSFFCNWSFCCRVETLYPAIAM